ncbi:unnamed protein product [Pseudo-nitzschia multistriata]|uniref:Uncharacterized protein n=1 Tax=Pseudo-nitzschia multistriata TaxID=183589 RepID=A0A448Z6G4_9STRA|nr:unnamed protein product [Pseudo-nitzschia multistriata]
MEHNNSERIRLQIECPGYDGGKIGRKRRSRTTIIRNDMNATNILSRRGFCLVFLLSMARFVPLVDAFVSLDRFSSRTTPCEIFRQKKNICFSTSSPEQQSSTPGQKQKKAYVNNRKRSSHIRHPSPSTANSNSTSSSSTTTATTMFRPSLKNSHATTNKYHHNRRQNNRRNSEKNHDNRNSIRIMFQTAKNMERQGRWGEAQNLLEQILQNNPKDSHSHLALARLLSRREGGKAEIAGVTQTKAQEAFARGTQACPRNIFLLQAWAIYEHQTRGDLIRARELFEECIEIDSYNPFVAHAYSLMERQLGRDGAAISLLKHVLEAPSAKVTAALVCTLGEIYISAGNLTEARDLYKHHIDAVENYSSSAVGGSMDRKRRRRHLPTEKDRVEVYLAAAWLEERHFSELRSAQDLLRKALAISPTSSLANVALARLEGRIQAGDLSLEGQTPSSSSPRGTKQRSRVRRHNSTEEANIATAKRLATICDELHQRGTESKKRQQKNAKHNPQHDGKIAANEDGRVFNALATLEVKRRRFKEAQEVLRKGMDLYPFDHNLFTAAGKVEERLGNYTRARDMYMESLRLEPSAPTLVAFALLELKHPQYPTTTSTETTIDKKHVLKMANFTLIRGLFEEALLLDPRNGPAYNAYGNAEARRGNLEEARSIFDRGTQANCSDAASIYHGYGMLEISCGNVGRARTILYEGLEEVRRLQDSISSDNPNRDRAAFLSHTLGMLELNANNPASALTIFEEGLERCGNSSQLLLGAALSEMRLGKFEAARDLFGRSVLADEKHAQAWQAWGIMETKAGNFDQASSLFQKGIKKAPWHGSLWHGYALLEMRRDNISNARTLFTGGLQKAKSRHDALYQGWATLEMREGNYEKARKLISDALTRNKRNGRGWIIAAEVEEEDGNEGLADLLLRRGIECDPDNGALYRKLGDRLVGKNNIDDARSVYEEGIEANPLYAPLYHSLAELEARICNLEALARLNKRANELFNNNAMEPAPRSDEALEARLKNRPVSSFFVDRRKQSSTSTAQRTPPASSGSRGGVLSVKIGAGDEDETVDIRDKNPSSNLSTIEDLNGEGLVGDIISTESILNHTIAKE